MNRPPFAVLAFGLVAACTTRDIPPAADTGMSQATDTAATVADSAPSASPDTSIPVAGSGTPPTEWTVNTRGIGPVSAGMTVAEAGVAAGSPLVVPATPEECYFARIKGAPADLMMMVQKGKISRVDVTRALTIATTTGAKIGDTEERIKSLYPNQVTVQPHKYTDGRYLVVTPVASADRNYRIVFETDGKKVLRYRSGLIPAVEYVEGCA